MANLSTLGRLDRGRLYSQSPLRRFDGLPLLNVLNLTDIFYPPAYCVETSLAVKLARTLSERPSSRLIRFNTEASRIKPLMCSTTDQSHSQLIHVRYYSTPGSSYVYSVSPLLASKVLKLMDRHIPRFTSLLTILLDSQYLEPTLAHEWSVSSIEHGKSMLFTTLFHIETGPSQLCSGCSLLHLKSEILPFGSIVASRVLSVSASIACKLDIASVDLIFDQLDQGSAQSLVCPFLQPASC